MSFYVLLVLLDITFRHAVEGVGGVVGLVDHLVVLVVPLDDAFRGGAHHDHAVGRAAYVSVLKEAP